MQRGRTGRIEATVLAREQLRALLSHPLPPPPPLDALEPGVPGRAHVPAGDWTVVFLHEGREVARRTATVRAGERIVVDGGS